MNKIISLALKYLAISANILFKSFMIFKEIDWINYMRLNVCKVGQSIIAYNTLI